MTRASATSTRARSTSAVRSSARSSATSSRATASRRRTPTPPISEPVKPIVYYIDPATPTWLVPFVKKGVEEWQVAFEAAGFRNAIIAQGSAEQDGRSRIGRPRGRALLQSIRWLPSTIENANGPSDVDPRTGEILNADVNMYHNIMNLQTWWYWTQVGPLDPRAAHPPVARCAPGPLWCSSWSRTKSATRSACRTTRIASGMYPADSVRSRTWVASAWATRRRSWTTRASTMWRSLRTPSRWTC